MSIQNIQPVWRCTNENSGGLEMLFSNERKLSLSIPTKDDNGSRSNIAFLVRYLCDTAMKDPRKELFVLDDTVYVDRPLPTHAKQPTD